MFVTLDGPVPEPRMQSRAEIVLSASETKSWSLFEMPFANIVPLGAGRPTGPVSFKLQVIFHYSTASTIGIQASPVYDVTIEGTLVTSLKQEKMHKSAGSEVVG
jgi:hypothetical protein